MKRKSVFGVLVFTAALTLTAACAGGAGSTPGAAVSAATTAAAPAAVSTAHNPADTAFAQGMIPHHRGAVEMAGLAATRAGSAQITQLATRIQQAQGPEIDRLQGFLRAWSEPETMPAGPMGGMNHGDMGHGDMSGGGMSAATPSQVPGMMSDQQMQQLEQASGAEFDRLFLQRMTEHHNGAIAMSNTELATGQNPEAKALAQQIVDAQQAEIGEMQGLLAAR